jgi:hypothetical protein
MRPLFVISLSSANAGSTRVPIVLVQAANGVPTDVLWGRLSEVEEGWSAGLCRGRDAPGVAKSHGAAFLLAITHERLVVSVQLELLRQLLLSHIEPLMVHIALVSTCPKIGWQMILDVYGLSHVLHLVAHPLAALRVSLSAWAVGSNPIRQVLVLWGRTLQRIEVELVLVRGARDAPLVHLLRHLALLKHTVQRVVDHLG